MRTSVTWVNDYLDRPADADEQARLLTGAGLNFDGAGTAENGEAWQEIETTSNRGDCLCHVGMAREICAMSGRELRLPPSKAKAAGPKTNSLVRVSNRAPEMCPRYTARVIRGVTVGPSPAWMQERLRAIGQVPRNNVVDCTNFVLFELGQPTHVFDLDTLKGPEIVVRPARSGERLVPIGEGAADLSLRDGDLVIADAERPVALAGVKGGAATAVTPRTRNLLLEAATFDPAAVRRASRGHRIASDSSYRFERGVHPAEIDAAAERLAALILETAGGELCDGPISEGAPVPAPRVLELRAARVGALLGVPVPLEEIVRALGALGFSPVVHGETIQCTIPPRRLDIEREIDLVEEVCRIHGLERIPLKETLHIRVAPAQPTVAAPKAAKDMLAGLGFVECVTHTLVSQRHAEPFLRPGDSLLAVQDERAAGTPILRPCLLPSLLEVRRRNVDAGTRHLRLFEFAHTFHGRAGASAPAEQAVVGLLVDDPQEETLRWLRGAVERTLRLLAGAHAPLAVRPAAESERAPYYSSQAVVTAAGKELGSIGVLSPRTLQVFGLEGTMAAAELVLEPLYAGYPPDARAAPLPAFPSIERDLSVIVQERVSWQQIHDLVEGARLPMFERLSFVGAYRGKQTGADRKSITLRVAFRAPDRTLRREEVDGPMAALGQSLSAALGAEIRA